MLLKNPISKPRMPRAAKKAIKKTFLNALLTEQPQIKKTKRVLRFLYQETMNYEFNAMLESMGISTQSDNNAISLGLTVNTPQPLKIKKIDQNFEFSVN